MTYSPSNIDVLSDLGCAQPNARLRLATAAHRAKTHGRLCRCVTAGVTIYMVASAVCDLLFRSAMRFK